MKEVKRVLNGSATLCECDAKNPSRMAFNDFSDWSKAESERLHGLKLTLHDSLDGARIVHNIVCDDSPVPEELDWRNVCVRVGPVKNQLNGSSCWASAITPLLEGQQAFTSLLFVLPFFLSLSCSLQKKVTRDNGETIHTLQQARLRTHQRMCREGDSQIVGMEWLIRVFRVAAPTREHAGHIPRCVREWIVYLYEQRLKVFSLASSSNRLTAKKRRPLPDRARLNYVR